jgi:hypothetical protein
MYRKSMEISWLIPRQELHITLALRFGEMNRMITKVIFGHLAALFIKWQP